MRSHIDSPAVRQAGNYIRSSAASIQGHVDVNLTRFFLHDPSPDCMKRPHPFRRTTTEHGHAPIWCRVWTALFGSSDPVYPIVGSRSSQHRSLQFTHSRQACLNVFLGLAGIQLSIERFVFGRNEKLLRTKVIAEGALDMVPVLGESCLCNPRC